MVGIVALLAVTIEFCRVAVCFAPRSVFGCPESASPKRTCRREAFKLVNARGRTRSTCGQSIQAVLKPNSRINAAPLMHRMPSLSQASGTLRL